MVYWKNAVKCRLVKSVSSLAIGQSNPSLFRNFQSSWLSLMHFRWTVSVPVETCKRETTRKCGIKRHQPSKWVSSSLVPEKSQGVEQSLERFSNTVKPVLSGHRTKRTPSIKLTVAEVPKLILFPLFTLNETFIKRTPLLSGRGHLKSTWNGHFYRCQPVLKGHL